MYRFLCSFWVKSSAGHLDYGKTMSIRYGTISNIKKLATENLEFLAFAYQDLYKLSLRILGFLGCGKKKAGREASGTQTLL